MLMLPIFSYCQLLIPQILLKTTSKLSGGLPVVLCYVDKGSWEEGV